MNKPALLAIVGPTASGKSSLGLSLAKQFNGEIINCDLLQMYRFFDIGSGKLTPAEQEGIPHHLLSVLEPTQRFAAGEYARTARDAISYIERLGKLPVIVGGTGFYLRALVDGLFPGPSRNPELRERLKLRASQKGLWYMHRVLHRLDPASAAKIHPNDTHKTIRAIEVCLQTRKRLSDLFQQGRQSLHGCEVLKLGLNPVRSALYEAINDRTKRMFAAGFVPEVKTILAKGVPRTAPPFQSLGYREVLEYLDGVIGLDQAIELTQIRTRQYAKRQITWFRTETDVHWFSGFGTDPQVQDDARRYILERL